MIKLTIEEDGDTYVYEISNKYIECNRQLTLFSARSPLLIRNATGEWLYKIGNCNYCGKCCIIGDRMEDISEQKKRFGVKEMDGKIVCKYLEKKKFRYFDEDVPTDSKAPETRTLGSPLKSKNNAELYMCMSARSPFGCCIGPLNIDKDYCTCLYAKLEVR